MRALYTLLLTPLLAGPPRPGLAWILGFAGQSTNRIIYDARMQALINTRVPAKASALVFPALGGPPDPILVNDNRFARDELRGLSEKRLASRDTDCSAMPDVVSCLTAKYQEQEQRLMHWTPSR